MLNASISTALAPSTSPARWACASAAVSTSSTLAVASCTFITERICAGIIGSMLWHWSSMNEMPAAGSNPPAVATSCRMRNSWNGSAAPTIRSSSA